MSQLASFECSAIPMLAPSLLMLRKTEAQAIVVELSCWLDGHEREQLSHRADRMIQKRYRNVEDGQRKKKRKTRHGGQMVEVCGPGTNLPVEIKTVVSFVAFHMLF